MKARVIGVAALLVAGLPQDGTEPFRLFAVRPYRLVNSVAFEPDDGTMIVALFHREVLAHRGMRVDSTAPELGLYQTRRLETGWSEPELLPVSGQYSDYEAALTPDGNTLVFNSKRPWPDGRIPDRNDLWLAERGPAGWGAPRPIAGALLAIPSARAVGIATVLGTGGLRVGTPLRLSTLPTARHWSC